MSHMHEYLASSINYCYSYCVECKKRTPHICIKCHYCYSCHPKIENIKGKKIQNKTEYEKVTLVTFTRKTNNS